jgi:hypothetical protein
MFAAFQVGTFKLPEPNTVSKLADAMKTQFRETDFVLTGYRDIPKGIRLEDGHNRVTAAFRAGVIPATVKMYLGERRSS